MPNGFWQPNCSPPSQILFRPMQLMAVACLVPFPCWLTVSSPIFGEDLAKLQFEETSIPGAWLIKPIAHTDNRGRFFRAWCSQEFLEHGVEFTPAQANMGLSHKKGTVRGMHYQVAPALEAKLVRCTAGKMFDVVLDMRPDSPTYLKWHGAELSAENGWMLYLPELCAHGYQTLVENTEMHYMASEVFTPEAARGVRFNDPAFNITWPLEASEMSDQDRNWPLYKV